MGPWSADSISAGPMPVSRARLPSPPRLPSAFLFPFPCPPPSFIVRCTMHRQQTLSRRRFLKRAGVLTSVPVLAALPAAAYQNAPGANEFLRLGWIGVGDRGSTLLRHALDSVSVSTLKVTAICDIAEPAREKAIARCGAMKPMGYADYRRLLEAKDVDAVFV